MKMRTQIDTTIIQKGGFFLLAFVVVISTVGAEPLGRSIFREARLSEETFGRPLDILDKKQSLIQALGIGDIQISETYGRVIDVYEGSSDETIIHIQDAHVHYEAQRNLAAILGSLMQKNHLRLVLVEGGDIRGKLSTFRKLASKEAREEVADRYLKKGLLAGDEYLELVSDYPMVRQGIEDPELYEENLRTFIEIEGLKKKALTQVEALQEIVQTLKQKRYSPAHLELEKKREAYDAEEIQLVNYYEYLNSFQTSTETPNIQKLLNASQLEKQIGFDEVDGERDQLIEILTETLSEDEVSLLIDKSLAYQEGFLPQNAYYGYLEGLAEQEEIPMSDYPNLEKYVYYLSLYSEIDHSELFREGDRLEEAVRESLLGSEDERQLASIDGYLRLLSNLFQMKISPNDYESYQKQRTRFSVRNFLPFLEKEIDAQGMTVRIPKDAEMVDEHLKTMDRFYRIAQARDVSFIDNSLSEMKKEEVHFAALVTGGFHTPGLTQILKERGISYIVISPRITQAGNPELYYSVVKQRFQQSIQ